MEFLLGVLLPYTACAVFIFGTVMKIAGWLKKPVPFHITLFPAPRNTTGKVMAFAGEFFFCRCLFRENKALWLQVWLFHLSLALVIAGHVVGIYCLRDQFTLVGVSPETSRFLSQLLGGLAGGVLVLSLDALLIGRIVDPVVRKLSVAGDFFSLLLLLALAVSGIMMHLPGFQADLPAVRAYMSDLIMFRSAALPDSATFVIHFLLVNILLLYFPFSRLFHSVGFFVNRAMLTENPPTYPTAAGATPRSSFASRAHANVHTHGRQSMEIGGGRS
jgi:nitrate reductase gamma subunit